MATLQTLLESVILSMSADNPGTALIQKNKPSQISKTMLFSDSAKTTRGDVSVFSLKPTISQVPKPSQTIQKPIGFPDKMTGSCSKHLDKLTRAKYCTCLLNNRQSSDQAFSNMAGVMSIVRRPGSSRSP